MASALQQQIQAQRTQIQDTKSQLEAGKRKSLERKASELRAKDNALANRLKRQQERDAFVKGLKQVTGQEIVYEKEVAAKAPEYGKEKYVEEEYSKAKTKLDSEIKKLDADIKRAEDRLKRAREKGDDEQEKEYETQINAAKAEQNVLKGYVGDKVKAIKGINSGIAFQEANYAADYVEDRARAKAQERELKKIQASEKFQAAVGDLESSKSYSEYLTKYQGLSSNYKDLLVSPSKIKESFVEKKKVELKLDVPAPAKVSGKEKLLQDIGFEGKSTPFGVVYEKPQIVKTQQQIRVDVPRQISNKDFGKENGIQFKYQPNIDSFVRTAPGVPEVSKSTLITRPPTRTERVIIDKYNEKGSFQKIVTDKVDKAFENPVIKTTSKIIRKIPVSVGVPFLFSYDTNVGEGIVDIKEKAGQITTYAAEEGYGDISQRFFTASEDKPRVVKNVLQSAGYLSLGVGEVTKATPEIIQYSTLGVVGGSAFGVLEAEQKIENSEKLIKENVEVQYQSYIKNYDKQKEDLQKGYELEPKLTKEEFKKEYGGEIETTILSGLKTERSISSLFLVGGLAGKGAKIVKDLGTKKIIKGTETGGKVIKLDVPEQQIQYSTEKGVQTLSKYKAIQIRTPITAYEQSTFGKLIGREPTLKVLARGQTYVTQPVESYFGGFVKTNKPYLAVTGRVGKAGNLVNRRFSIISGEGTEISKEAISQLPNREKYILSNLIEKTKTGTPVASSNIGKLITDEQKIVSGITGEYKIFGSLGSKTNLYKTTTLSTPITKFESGIETFRIETGAKNVGKPLWRATGNIDVTGGTLIRFPVFSEVAKEVNYIGSTGAKSSESYLKQLYKLEKPKPIVKPKVEIKPASPTKVITDLEPVVSERSLPLMVGGAGLKTLPFEGTSQYEVAESFSPAQVSRINLGLIETPKNIQTINTDIKLNVKTDTMQELKLGTKLKTLNIQKPISDLASKIKTQQIPMQEQLPKLRQLQIPKTAQELKTDILQISKTTTSQTPKPQPTPTPKTTIIPKKSISQRLATRVKEEPGIFEVFVTKGGKDIGIGKATTQREAESILRKELKGTLRAGGFLTKGGKKVKAKELQTFGGGEFRLSKLSEFKVIQKKERRLGAFGERKEIQYFKGSSKKGKKKNTFGF